MRLGEDDLGSVVIAGATAHVARFSVGVMSVDALDLRGVVGRHLGWHGGHGTSEEV